MLHTSHKSLIDHFPSEWSEILRWPGFRDALLEANALAGDDALPHPFSRYEAFRLTPPENVKVVLVGNGLHAHNARAHGLAYSVPFSLDRSALPVAVRNFQSELCSDIGIPVPAFCDLTPVAEQGALLLNLRWTLDARGIAAGNWEPAVLQAIRFLSARRPYLVFVFLGNDTRHLIGEVDRRHDVLSLPEPSSREAAHGFFGSRPFSRINTLLVAHDESPINWARIAESRRLPTPRIRDYSHLIRRIGAQSNR